MAGLERGWTSLRGVFARIEWGPRVDVTVGTFQPAGDISWRQVGEHAAVVPRVLQELSKPLCSAKADAVWFAHLAAFWGSCLGLGSAWRGRQRSAWRPRCQFAAALQCWPGPSQPDSVRPMVPVVLCFLGVVHSRPLLEAV